jgi:hypothetical protein
MNICITPELFSLFCDELQVLLEGKEQLHGIDLSEIKSHILQVRTEYCE